MAAPHLFLVGATHRTAPFGFREKLSLPPEAEAGFSRELLGLRGLREFAILNTCNRVEVYGVATEENVPDQVAAAFCARQHVAPAEFSRFGFVSLDRDAVGHLLEVASGLDSQMLGETEIFGQVKRAYANAQARGTVGIALNRLFQKAFQAAKHIRTSSAVSLGQVSVANVAVELALNVFGRLEGVSLLLVGAGEMGEKSGRAFLSRGANRLTVCSRHRDHAAAVARSLEAQVLPFDEREIRLGDYDIVVCSTSAPGIVITAEAVRGAVAARAGRPQLLIDLAMPRDIAASAADLHGVFLYNLDDLAALAEKNRLARQVEAERSREVLAPRAESLWTQLQLPLGGLPATGANRPSAGRAVFPPAVFASA